MPATATDRLNGITTSVAIKAPCRVATTANITLSGLQTVDAIAIAADDRVAVKNQTNPVENGIYKASTSAWSRAPDFDGTLDAVKGTLVIVDAGTTNSRTIWQLTTANPITIGTSSITFEKAVLLDSAVAAFTQSGAGTVERTAQAKMRDIVNAKDFTGVVLDAANDDTVGLQAAENNATAAGKILWFPGGSNAKITDQISRGNGSQWLGEHRNQGNTTGFTNGTKITFAPTSAKSLFVPTAPVAAFRVGFATDGFHIAGNSTTSAGNSIYAFDVDGINKSRFSNLTITGFRRGIRCNATINNRFEFVNISDTYISSVLYDGGICTSDVWDQCYFGNSPIGIDTTAGNSHVGIRFHAPIFESITTYGMDLTREVYGWMVLNAYVEDTPNANVSTNAMFRVGFRGSAGNTATNLIINGGYIAGRNAGAVGALLDVDYTDGVILGGFHAARYTNVVRTSANTLTNQVACLGWTSTSISTQVSDETKVTGFWSTGVSNSSSRNQQTHRIAGEQVAGASTACTGAITTAVNWVLEKNGSTVTLKLPATTGTASAAASFAYGEALPARFRPSATLSWLCPIRDNAAENANPGLVSLNYLTGVVTVYRSSNRTTNFTGAADAGLTDGFSVSWTV